MHIYALLVKIQEHANKCTILQYPVISNLMFCWPRIVIYLY